MPAAQDGAVPAAEPIMILLKTRVESLTARLFLNAGTWLAAYAESR
jgi:hypothetical protein